MDKRIIGKLRTHIKLVVIISAILISGLVVIISIYIPLKEIYESEPNRNIAIDDTFTYGLNEDDYFGHLPYLKSQDSDLEYTHVLMKFDCKEKPSSRVNISFYIYENYDYCSWEYLRMWLSTNIYNGIRTMSWNENMNSKEILDIYNNNSLTRQLGGAEPNFWNTTVGFVNFEITDFVFDLYDNIDLSEITLQILEVHGMWNEGYILIHSKEANVPKEYLPQLIWS